MTNSPDPSHTRQDNAQSDNPDKQENLKKFVEERDTDENLQKLGKALAKDWKSPEQQEQSPDLSFEKFEKKIPKR